MSLLSLSRVAAFKLSSKAEILSSREGTVPPGTIYPFAAVFSRSIRGAMPRFHLDNDAACRKFFAVLPNFTAACDSAVNSVPRWS